MKTLQTYKILILLIVAMMFMACRTGRERAYNTGSATDRTGTNGATVGDGKVP